jgi:ABC-type transport system involved in multi-copper enzyme maturation permease subunit
VTVGVDTLAPPSQPAASSGAPRRGFGKWLDRVKREPNPIWMREMRQAARLGRTPWVLFGLTLIISLLMCGIGGVAASTDSSPATLGETLFQVFFSIAYLVVTIVGPAIAANSIASEREGRTWEAVLLTGLTPKQITRGKFFAAYTTIALYIIALAPVGALSFLFGGVTAGEVVVAFVFLFALAALSVAFGLAVSSLMSSLRGAIVVTLILAICIGPALYLIFGVTCSFGIHELWSDVPSAMPIWLPLAYTRAKFGLEYIALLFGLPLLLLFAPAWFLYEVTIANLTGDAEDRSSGLKRWFAVTTPLLAVACAAPGLLATDDESRKDLGLVGISAFLVHVGFCAILFTAEPPGPSRRVRIHWERAQVGRLRRFFGPGLSKTSLLVALFGIVGIAAIASAIVFLLQTFPTTVPSVGLRGSMGPSEEVLLYAAYLAPFFVFVVGLTSWLRSRSQSPWIARLIAAAILFLIAAGPWVVAAIGGVVSNHHDDDWLMIAAPSPFYVFAMLKAVGSTDNVPVIPTGLSCAAVWGVLGLGLLAAAARRCARTIADYDRAIFHAEAALRAEEEAKRPADTAVPAAEGQEPRTAE